MLVGSRKQDDWARSTRWGNGVCELRGGVTLAAEDVEGDVGLIADHPAVVSGRDVEEVASPHHHFASSSILATA